MGMIRVHEFTTMDGVIDEPRWASGFGFDPKMGEAIANVMGGCDAILLGRVTYQMFEPAWSVRSAQDDPGAPFMNDTTKYVISTTLTSTTWRNTEIVGPYDPDAIRRLKDRVNGGLYVSGSGTLVRALLADNLVDELHLFVYPITRAGGPRLFGPNTGAREWALADSRTYDNGVAYLHYETAE
ncbi:MAG TPA: dihydrofolate reductase family protein [Streptosporangiaceae bacterium]